jgi:LAO/AO transport system kinase
MTTMMTATESAADRAAQVAAGSVRHASRLITHVENGRPEARATMRELAGHCGRAQLVGITGPPGAGKSSLTAALIREIRASGRTVGVVAVDPSSPFSGGALLGDRDRMVEASSGDPGVFIRSVASRGAPGGLAAAVDDAVDVMDASGLDVVIVETVGVGQGELEIAKIAHTVVLVLVPGYGDSLQAMKAGITEIADVVAVNKGDLPGADAARRDLRSQGYERRSPGDDEVVWPVPVVLTSALRHEGVDELLRAVDDHYAFTAATGWKAATELRRRRARFTTFVEARLRDAARRTAGTVPDDDVLDDPYGAADTFVRQLIGDPATEDHPRDRPGTENHS